MLQILVGVEVREVIQGDVARDFCFGRLVLFTAWLIFERRMVRVQFFRPKLGGARNIRKNARVRGLM